MKEYSVAMEFYKINIIFINSISYINSTKLLGKNWRFSEKI